MNLKELTEHLSLRSFTRSGLLSRDVATAYTSDLLSDVMANSRGGTVWITLQVHPNIIAVAKLKDLAGVILVNDREPQAETLKKAEEENIALLGTKENAYTISGRLFALLKGGRA